MKCAAFELPFTTEETYGQVNVQDVLGVLQESGLVHKSGAEDEAGQWNWTSESYPANAVSLRSISSDNFVITDHTDGAKVIGETDFSSALSTLHPKAIYMVEGKIYQVEELDFVGRKAHVREVDCDYYTTAITYTKVSILDRFETADVALHGEVHVVSRVVGFKKIRFHTNENVGSGELDLPEQQMHTTSYWLEVPLAVMNALPYATDDRRDGVVGLAFAMKQVAQLLLMCDARDIGLSVNAGDDQSGTDWSAEAPMVPERRRIRRASFFTMRTRAASASARRCGACSRSCCRARARSSWDATATPAARCVWGR